MSSTISTASSPMLSPATSSAASFFSAPTLLNSPVAEQADVFETRRERFNPLRLTDTLSRPAYRKGAAMVIGTVVQGAAMLAVRAGLMALAPGWAVAAIIVGTAVGLNVSENHLRPLVGDPIIGAITLGSFYAVLSILPLPAVSLRAGFDARNAAALAVGSTLATACVGAALSHLPSRNTKPILTAAAAALGYLNDGGLILTAAAALGLPAAQRLAISSVWHVTVASNLARLGCLHLLGQLDTRPSDPRLVDVPNPQTPEQALEGTLFLPMSMLANRFYHSI